MKIVRKSPGSDGFTLIETLVVVAIILILAGVAFPAYKGMIRGANRTHTVNGLKNMTNGVHLWAADNANKIPSPVYPGGHKGELPAYSTLNVQGEDGMWLNGVVYAVIAIGMDNMLAGESVTFPPDSPAATGGDHLIGTVFESKVSVKANPKERDWFRHSYAMNANLQYDEINDMNGSSDPWLTEKDVTKYDHPRAMLFVDCDETNVVYSGDSRALVEAADRHGGKFIFAGFLDGSVRKVAVHEIPTVSPDTDRDSSLFWRGVPEKRR